MAAAPHLLEWPRHNLTLRRRQRANRQRLHRCGCPHQPSRRLAGPVTGTSLGGSPARCGRQAASRARAGFGEAPATYAVHYRSPAPASCHRRRGVTTVGADGRTLDGGRSAAALWKRPQHNLTLRRRQRANRQRLHRGGCPRQRSRRQAGPVTGTFFGGSPATRARQGASRARAGFGEAPATYAVHYRSPAPAGCHGRRGVTTVGADGRALDGGRSAAALWTRPQHNLTLGRPSALRCNTW